MLPWFYRNPPVPTELQAKLFIIIIFCLLLNFRQKSSLIFIHSPLSFTRNSLAVLLSFLPPFCTE